MIKYIFLVFCRWMFNITSVDFKPPLPSHILHTWNMFMAQSKIPPKVFGHFLIFMQIFTISIGLSWDTEDKATSRRTSLKTSRRTCRKTSRRTSRRTHQITCRRTGWRTWRRTSRKTSWRTHQRTSRRSSRKITQRTSRRTTQRTSRKTSRRANQRTS